MRKELLRKAFVLIIAVTAISLLYKNDLVLVIVLVAIFLWNIKGRLERYDLPIFLGAAIFCSLGEVVCVNYNCWTYSNPTILGIPLWLPVAWGIVAVSFKRIGKKLAEKELSERA